ncbi:16S rRNA (cytosine(1402)-N(4))-methyltransferase RsmH [Desulfoplanes sp.]
MDDSVHIPVMADEVCAWLHPVAGGRYFDGTLGLGGHTLQLIKRAEGKIEVLATDKDTRAIEVATSRLEGRADQVAIAHCSFKDFETPMRELGWDLFDGVILDLGVSSMQVDTVERGFSFHRDGPLDMRMDKDSGRPSAKHLLARLPVHALKKIIQDYGEEPMAGRIARAIVNAREHAVIETTGQLAEIVAKAYPPKRRALARNHPATKTFQAIRIAVNQELEDLRFFLERIPAYLAPGGRIAVISFHSLEDRIVKRVFRNEAKGCICPRYQPICVCGHVQRLEVLTKKPVVPSEQEMATNPRSRSAKLRVAEGVLAP